MRRRLFALALTPAVALLAGCGTARVHLPDLARVLPPYGFRTLAYPQARVALSAPRDWTVSPGHAPLVMVASSGPAVIALWRYRSGAAPPGGAAGLAGARDALLAAAARHGSGFHLIRAALVRVQSTGAVELDTLQTMGGQQRRLRSLHVYAPGEELVLEEYAPPAMFHRIDHESFSPVKRSLRLLPSGAA